MFEMEFVKIDSKPSKKSILEDLEEISFGGNVRKTEDKKQKKKEKKKDKKVKKKKETPSYALDISPISTSSDDGEEQLDIEVDLNELIDELFDEDGNPIVDPIIDEQKNNYKKRKNDKNPFKKEFAEEMTLLYDLYDNVSSIAKDLEKHIKQSSGSKTRGNTKTHADMVANLLSAKMNQLQVIKELNSVKKTMADLKLKDEARNAKDQAGDSNTSLMASSYLQQMLNAGRNNILQSMRGTTKPGFLVDSYVDENDDGEVETMMDLQGTVPGYSDEEEFQMNQFLIDRLDDEEYNMRTSDGNKLIQYERRGVEVCVKHDVSTGDYEFIALDKDNMIVHDYPLPRSPGKMKFAGPNATDRYGNAYRVIEYDSMAFED